MRQLALLLLFLAVGCSPQLSADWTKENYTGKSFKKIAVVGISKDLAARNNFEKEAVALYQKAGINAVAGIDFFPPNMSEAERQPANLRKIVKANNLDAVITMSLIDAQETTRYEPGDTYVVAGAYRGFGRYYR